MVRVGAYQKKLLVAELWVMVYLIASFAIIPMHHGLLICGIMIAVSYHAINIQLKMYKYLGFTGWKRQLVAIYTDTYNMLLHTS